VTVHFDEALTRAVRIAEELREAGFETSIVRDVLGRCRLVIDDRQRNTVVPPDLIARAVSQLTSLGPYAPADSLVVVASELLDGGALLDAPDRAFLSVTADGDRTVPLIERTIMGLDWRRAEARGEPGDQTSVVFYSLKGGVGRSTAAIFLAHQLADDGRCVVLVDLDLESPGLGPLVLPSELHPDFGVVDVLSESAVGNDVAMDAVARCLDRAGRNNGEVWLAPASGRPREGYTYLPKLDRAYLDLPTNDGALTMSFADRLRAAVTAVSAAVEERSRRPSVVLIDSRAGMHDVAGVALTHLADVGLLFAADSELTWWGYRTLLAQWVERPDVARHMRERLKLVAAMVDRSDPLPYLAGFTDRAAAVFEIVYDQASPDDLDSFSPSRDDVSAPHYPLPILFDQDLRHLNAAKLESALPSQAVRASFEAFIAGVREMLGDEQ
jgi:hypothetical protein